MNIIYKYKYIEHLKYEFMKRRVVKFRAPRSMRNIRRAHGRVQTISVHAFRQVCFSAVGTNAVFMSILFVFGQHSHLCSHHTMMMIIIIIISACTNARRFEAHMKIPLLLVRRPYFICYNESLFLCVCASVCCSSSFRYFYLSFLRVFCCPEFCVCRLLSSAVSRRRFGRRICHA